MKYVAIAFAAMVAFILAVVASVGIYYVSVNNQENNLRKTAANKQTLNEASLDTMWKILKDKAGVAEQGKEAFKQIYPELIKARNMDKNLLVKFVTEQNPKFSLTLYKDLSNAVEAQRKSFYNNQKELLNIKNQHDILISSMPSKWFISNTTPLVVTIVTSDDAEMKFKTGKDNDTLFGGAKK